MRTIYWLFIFVFPAVLSAQTLKPLKSVPEAGKVVALTFDDGIEPAIHKEMLKILEKEKVPATFFLIGDKCTHKKQIKKTIKAGHELGNHTMSHAVLPDASQAKVEAEIIGFQKLFEEQFNYTPKVFRAPKLQYDEGVMQILAEQKLIPVNATVGTRDYADETTVEYIVNTATQSLKLGSGSIILMHEKEKTALALPQIISFYKEKGYAFLTVSQLINKKAK